MPEIEYAILGPMAVRLAPDAAAIPLGEQSRILLGRLLLDPGAVVSIDALGDALWGDEERKNRRNGVHTAVKAARVALGDTVDPRRIIVRFGEGYRIDVGDPLLVDAERFKHLAACGHDLAERLPRAARTLLSEALSIPGGPLFGEHADSPWAAGHARELASVRDRVELDLNEARLALGEYARLDATLRKQIVEHPHDERRRAQLVRALDGAGGTAEAGLAYREAFRDLGVLGPALRALGDRIGRGLPADPPAVADAQLGTSPDGVLLCAILERRDRRRDDRALGTLTLHADRRGGVCDPVAGDRLVAAFDDLTDALQAARVMAADIRLRPAVGIHVGGIVRIGGRLAGPGPARCWQLAGAANPGQVLLSADAQARAEPGEDLRDLGIQRFEDLAPGEPVFELRSGEPSSDPPHTLSQMPHNLPVQPTRFVGRDAELTRLARLVAGGELITLIGAGGCGKTRLALQLAARCVTRFAGGAWFVGLAGLDGDVDTEAVAATVATGLGVRALPGESVPEALVRHHSDRPRMLVLDNCEQIYEPCGELVALLHTSCTALCIVVTSRRQLRVDGERVVAVPPMRTDNDSEPGSLSDAVELLLERAGPLPDGGGADTLTDAARICRALDGLPLAIELAAAQVTTRGLAGVAVEVEEMMSGKRHLDLFETKDPGRHPRQRTIEAAIDWSHKRLSRDEQRALHALAVFRGTFGLAEAQVVVANDELDAAGIAGILASLVECSMVAAAPPLASAARLRLVDPIRAFALLHLDDDGELEATRGRHARAFAALARGIAPQMFGPGEQVSLERLEADHDNLRAALGWLVERGHGAEALKLVGSLWWLWFSHGHLAEGSSWVERALALDGQPSRERVRALRAGSHLAWWQGNYAAADDYNVELEQCAAAIDDAWGLAWAPMGQGAVELFSDPRNALALFEDSRRRFEELGRHWEAGYALQVIGGAWWFGGEEQAALKAFEEAVEIFERLEHRSVLASVQRSAGLMAARCGQPGRGLALCRAALVTSTAIDDRAGNAQALNFLAAISREQGDLETALARYADALSDAHEVGELWATCWALDGIAGLACAAGEDELAVRLFACSGRLAKRAGIQQFPTERRLRESDIGTLRARLGDDFDRAYTEGELLRLREAVASALAFVERSA